MDVKRETNNRDTESISWAMSVCVINAYKTANVYLFFV